MAKLYTGGFEVIGLGGSWHGVTGNAGSVSFASDRKGYGPGMPGTFAIPEPNAYRCPVRHCRDKCDRTCMKIGFEMFDMQSAGAPAAIIAEPVISAGGVIVPPEGYFDALKAEARKRGMLLIFDEAQTAFGRLGHWFAAAHLGVTPDILTVSKTLGGGLPLAGVITSDEIEEKCHQRGFSFYTSHVSDPLPSSVGLAVLETIEQEKLLERSRDMGAYLAAGSASCRAATRRSATCAAWACCRGIELVKDRETREPHHELGCAHHAALPGTGAEHEHPPPSRTRLGVAHRAAADGDDRGHRPCHDHFRPGAGRGAGHALAAVAGGEDARTAGGLSARGR